MTEISFHLHVADVQQHTLRLLHKVWRTYPKVALVGPEDYLQAVSLALGAQSPSAFVPHCWASESLAVQNAGSLVLAQAPDLAHISPHFETLVHLGQSAEPTPGFERFLRLVELVPAADEQVLAAARQRWRHYQRRGYPLQSYDLAKKAAN